MSVVTAEQRESPVARDPIEIAPVATAPRASRFRQWHLVLLLTLLAGVLRFSFLDRPPLWFDESMTFMRVSGTYQQMLDRLEEDGFAPLHYQLYWVIRQWRALTPFMMRLVPALCGTLMVPVMYWLASQIVSRRAALVTAIFTATSAYQLGYSRDAKMYSDFWFFCALSVATLLWWLRVRTLSSWLCWVASSCAMLGLHTVGAGTLAIELLIVLTAQPGCWRPLVFSPVAIGAWPVVYAYPVARRFINPRYVAPKVRAWNWLRNEWRAFCRWPVVAFGLGIVFVAAGPLGYYWFFNKYAERIERAGWMGTGIHWVTDYNRGRNTWDLVQYTSTAYLYNWEWPRQFKKPRIQEQDEVNPRVLGALKGSGIALFSLLALGALPWPRRWRGARDDDRPPAREWWRALLWISAWLLLPGYGFYCASVRNFTTPGDWILAMHNLIRAHPIVMSFVFATILAAAVLLARLWRALDTAMLFAVPAGLLLLCYVAAQSIQTQRGSVWMPRYLGFIWPAFAIAVAVLLCRLPTRPLRWAAIALLVGINLSVFTARVFATSEPPVDRMARDLLAAQPDNATTRMYYGIRQSFNGGPGWGVLQMVPGRYYLAIYSGRPTNPRDMMAAIGIGQIWDKFKRWPRVTSLVLDSQIVADVSKNPQLDHIVVWDRFDRKATEYPDRLATPLGPSWRLNRSEVYRVREHWTWRELYQVRRREYERIAAPATAPATAPTSQPTTR